MNQQEITLRVPGKKEYALVLRLALGGVAILKDLDAGALDDLRNASDEAVDCLLHQGRDVSWLTLHVLDGREKLNIRICAEFTGEGELIADAEETEISRAVLETLIPEVEMQTQDCGCINAISLTLKKAVAMGA
ncbi:MAG: hypothetical protein IKL25_02825 [Clostridia bacterium]|nr:hypothetical protein [Clostridia bacterium]